MTDEAFERWRDWANDIAVDMREWEVAVTASRAAETERELDAHDCAVACFGAKEMGDRGMRCLKILERWAGTLILVTLGVCAVDALCKGEIIAGLFGVLFLVTVVAMWQREKRLLARDDDQALVASLPQDIRVCRVEHQGEELVFRDLGTQAMLLPLRMGDISYLADPELMPQYRNRSGHHGEHTG